GPPAEGRRARPSETKEPPKAAVTGAGKARYALTVTQAPDPEPVITYESRPAPAMQFAVNFGVFAGREVTRLELNRLAQALLELVPAATILSEQRFELDARSEALLHQVRVEIAQDALPATADVEALRGRLASLLTDW